MLDFDCVRQACAAVATLAAIGRERRHVAFLPTICRLIIGGSAINYFAVGVFPKPITAARSRRP